MSRSSSSAAPFWQQSPKPPAKPRLAGTYDSLVAAAGECAIPKYDRAGCYELGGLLEHAAYGVGVVVEQPKPGKVLLRFRDRDRLLVCGRA